MENLDFFHIVINFSSFHTKEKTVIVVGFPCYS